MLCLRVFTGQCSGAISGRSVWQENLVSLDLTFDARCEGWGFEKILLRFCALGVFCKPRQAARFHLQRISLAKLWFCGCGLGRTVDERGAVLVHCGSGSLLQCTVPPRDRSGPLCKALSASASEPFWPSVEMRGPNTPFSFCKVSRVGVRNFQSKNPGKTGAARTSITMRCAASAPFWCRSGPALQCAANTPFAF